MHEHVSIEPRILIDENIPMLHEALSSRGKITLFSGRKLTRSHIADAGGNMLFVRSTTKVNKSLLQDTDVKFVAAATSGFDNIDTDWLMKFGASFYHAPGSNSNSVAEYVIYSILKWAHASNTLLAGKTIGIIGYGNIGRLVAKYAGRMGLKVLLNDPPLADAGFSFPPGAEYCELHELLRNADIVTNHVPYTTTGIYRTHDLLSTNELMLIRPGSLVIHASRGGIVNEEALCMAAGDRFALTTDVWYTEPLVNPVIAGAALLATPHIAGYSRDGKIRGVAMMLDAFRDFTGTEPDYTAVRADLSRYKPLEPEAYTNHAKLYSLLEQNRLLGDDHDKLAATLGLDNEERARAFDKIRKEYPERRETL